MQLYLITAWAGAVIGVAAFRGQGVIHAVAAAPVFASILTLGATVLVNRYWPARDGDTSFAVRGAA